MLSTSEIFRVFRSLLSHKICKESIRFNNVTLPLAQGPLSVHCDVHCLFSTLLRGFPLGFSFSLSLLRFSNSLAHHCLFASFRITRVSLDLFSWSLVFGHLGTSLSFRSFSSSRPSFSPEWWRCLQSFLTFSVCSIRPVINSLKSGESTAMLEALPRRSGISSSLRPPLNPQKETGLCRNSFPWHSVCSTLDHARPFEAWKVERLRILGRKPRRLWPGQRPLSRDTRRPSRVSQRTA